MPNNFYQPNPRWKQWNQSMNFGMPMAAPPQAPQGGAKLSVSQMMGMQNRGGPNMSLLTDAKTGQRLSNQESENRGGFFSAGWNAGGMGHRGYGGGYMQRQQHESKPPSAKTSEEYYANRDAAQGNPLDKLFWEGPGGQSLREKMMSEAQSKKSNAYSKGDAFDQVYRRDHPQGDSMPTGSDLISESSSGDTVYADGTTGIQTSPTSREIYGPYGHGSSVQDPFANSPTPPPSYQMQDQIAEMGPVPDFRQTQIAPSAFYQPPPPPPNPTPLQYGKDIARGAKGVLDENSDYFDMFLPWKMPQAFGKMGRRMFDNATTGISDWLTRPMR